MMDRVLVDRYEIRKQLGKKPGRQTLLAWDRQVKNLVVIKLLSFSQEFVWDDLKLFEREAETLRTLSHSAIPQYLDFFEVTLPHAHSFALVQSYVEGDSLESHLKSGQTFSELDVKQLAVSLLEILVYLHDRQPPVIHRDIKPSNILLRNRSGNSIGDVYLVDFGSVQTLAATEGGTITIVGTFGYMPPEQFGGRTVPASDLYGLGATLIYVATGRHPADIPQKQLKLQFESLTTLSSELTQWLARLVEPGLDERFVSAAAALQKANSLNTHQKVYIEQPAAEITLTPITKPPSSRIELSKSANLLTIQFPQTLSKRTHSPSPLFKNVPVWFTVGLMLAFINPALPVSLLPLWISGVCLEQIILRFFRRPLTKCNSLRIDQHQITLNLYEQDKLKTSIFSPRQKITGLEYRIGDEGCYALTIWADKQYELSSRDSLSAQELQWLAYELGRWLDLPIQQTKQHLPLPIALFRKGVPEILPSQAVVEKPIDSKIVLLKRPGWIDILIPFNSSQNTDGYTRLYIDHQQIHQTSAFKKDPLPSLRMAINAIEYHSHSDNSDGFLRVWAGRQRYDLGEDGSLSAAELDWLAYELSQWLGLPVYRT
ncbi:serine/threonine protein kinase [Kovacikia minuta CCNUW1]|uniref:serine/threonine protein kinase n=1 Tax=Kovacikia minuta TaxID=2931930 RepID=UPI001CC996D3|nr:serine/threonine-protein kinase [Kovacikia minuta]UBF23769.1 serine/threonine protein kinase [Kovacikia minuta CCNUW1]